MVKVSEERSSNRRYVLAYLEKTAQQAHTSPGTPKQTQPMQPQNTDYESGIMKWLNPSYVGGGVLGLGGGALAASAFGDNNSSGWDRLWKLLAGAGLGWAGYKLITDPRARELVQRYARKGYDFLNKHVGGFFRNTAGSVATPTVANK